MNIIRHISSLLPVAAALLIAACSDEYNDTYTMTKTPHYLSVDKSSLSYSAAASTQNISIQSVSTPWSLTNNSDWVNLSSSSGTATAEVAVGVAENSEYSTTGRASVLTLSSTDGSAITRTIAVNQESPALLLNVSPTTVSMPGSASSASVMVQSNTTWSYALSDDSWLTASKTNEGLTLNAKENATGAARSATISIQVGSKYENVRVTQQAATVEVSATELNLDYTASSANITVTAEAAWTATTDYDWISISQKAGNAGTTNVVISVEANTQESARTGSVTIGTRVITINQKAYNVELSVSPQNVSMKGGSSTAEITVSANGVWEYSVGTYSWLTVTPTISGLSLSAAENTTTDTRTAYINITLGSHSKQVVVSQLPASLDGLTDVIDFGVNAETKSLTFTSESSWQAKTNYSWITLSPAKGNAGTSAIGVSVTTNASREARQGSFTINNSVVTVNQEGTTLTPSPSALTFSENGETLTVDITCNTTWTLTSTVDWLSIDKTSGNGNDRISITAGKNDDDPRNGRIKIETGTGIIEYIEISQNANGITVVNTLSPFAADGATTTLDPIEFSSWSATVPSEYSWIHCSPLSGNSSNKMTITVDKTTDIDDRTGYIDIQYSNKLYRVNVNQYGAGIIASQSQYSFAYKGGTAEPINVQYNGSVSVTSSATWLAPSLSGNLLTLVAGENLTSATRQATVTLQLAGSDSKATITVTQASQHGNFSISGYDDETSLTRNYVSAITLSSSSLSLNVGDTQTLAATVTPTYADNKSILWSSSNTAVATVSTSGVITAIAAGTATITATAADGGGAVAKCSVTVNTIKVTSISLSASSATLTIGDTKTLTATVSPSNATDKTIAWSSSNTSVATVSTSGVVTAKAVGSAAITATANDGSGVKASCAITVNGIKVTSISLSTSSATLTVGDTKTLTATVSPSNATDKTITWSSSNTSVATVSTSGVVTAKSAGSATISATANDGSGVKGTCAVTVEKEADTGYINGHEYVTIGGIKWATMNVGATTVAGSYSTCYGNYYAWGETSTRYSSIYRSSAEEASFSWKSSFPNGYSGVYPDYTGTTLDASHDAATTNWGSRWRTPTNEEFTALYKACGGTGSSISGTLPKGTTSTSSKGIYWCENYNGVNGLLFSDGKYKLFFPAAGDVYGDYLTGASTDGGYWSSSIVTSLTTRAYNMFFNDSYMEPSSRDYRYRGFVVRAIAE